MQVALAQINSELGAFAKNRKEILKHCRLAHKAGAELIVFPELALYGYPPNDLLERAQTVTDQLKEFEKISEQMPEGLFAVLGLVTENKSTGRPFQNSAAALKKGSRPKFFSKTLLPAYDVFDEGRHFQPGDLEKNILKFKGHKILVTLCEDIWAWDPKSKLYKENPFKKLRAGGVDLIINLSASPFALGKESVRQRMAEKTAKHLKAPLIYVNAVGAQDELIFDGASFALSSKGEKVAELARFQTDFKVLSLKNREIEKEEEKISSAAKSPGELLRQALVLGIREFCQQTGLKKIHFGLSGGVDSALAACLAVEALGPESVHALALPGPYSSPLSLELAKELSENLNISLDVIPITPMYEAAAKGLDQAWGEQPFGILHENLQARLRGLILMAYANKMGSLLLNTSNKSEFASGYSTLYGDMCGGLSPLGDLLKSQVFTLTELYLPQGGKALERILARKPTAELAPDQVDENSLPPYEKLDGSVKKLVEEKGPVTSTTDRWLSQALLRSEFKRWQAPPILKVSDHAFGRGRRWPISQSLKRI